MITRHTITRHTMTRRAVLLAAGAGALAMPAARAQRAETEQTAPQRSKVDFVVPHDGCDCHVHVADPARFPYAAGRLYTPPPATLHDLRILQRDLHLHRAIIVTPSFSGTDNAVTLDAVRRLGPRRARGVAVVADDAPDAELDDLAKGGIRGTRLGLQLAGTADPAEAGRRIAAAALRAKPRGWHVQIYAQLPLIVALHEQLAALPVPVVLDHFGGARGALGVGQPGFATLVDLLKGGNTYIKVSAAYRIATPPDYADAAPLARALIAANPDRILWGSDWPHPDSRKIPGHGPADLAPYLPVDDGQIFNLLPVWAPDAALRRRILVENPARLYGF